MVYNEVADIKQGMSLQNLIFMPDICYEMYPELKASNAQFACFLCTAFVYMMFYSHFCARGRLNGSSDLPKVIKRSQRQNNLQICPCRDSNTGGSDL